MGRKRRCGSGHFVYADEFAARLAIRVLARRHSLIPAMLSCYGCPRCQGWHVHMALEEVAQ